MYLYVFDMLYRCILQVMLVLLCIFPYTGLVAKKIKMTDQLKKLHPVYPAGSLHPKTTDKRGFIKLLPKSISRLVVICMAILVGLALTYTLWAKHVAAEQQASINQQLQLSAEFHRQNNAFDNDIQKLQASYPDIDLSVSVATQKTGIHRSGLTQDFDAASTAKLITAAALLHKVDENQASLQQQIAGQSAIYWLRQMIIESDDNAWLILNTYLSHDYMSDYARSNGLANYDVVTNQLSSRDMGLLLKKLTDGNLLSSRRQTLLLSLMQKANYREYIVAAVPAGYTVAHKVGLTDNYIDDAAIISKDDKKLVLTIYSKRTEDSSQGQTQLIREVTRAAISDYLKS
jgi:beta-lactamase class A